MAQPQKTYFEDFVVNPSRASSAMLGAVITIVKGRQVPEIVRQLFHLETFDDFVDLLTVPKVGPFCSNVSIN